MAGKKILVADDSLTIQKVIRLALSNEGYDIQTVSDGNNAIQKISLTRPDIVLIDVSLPIQSAFQVKREINQNPDLALVCFILMSSAFEKVDETQITQVHFEGRLTKPFDPAHLRKILKDVLIQKSESIHSLFPPLLEEEKNHDWMTPIHPQAPSEVPKEFHNELHTDIKTLADTTLELTEIGLKSPLQKPNSQTPNNDPSPSLNLDDPFPWIVNEPSTNQNQTLPPPFSLGQHSTDLPPQKAPPTMPLSQALDPSLSDLGFSKDEIELLILKKVEETLNAFSKSHLPEIAEKLLKKEIHQLLSE